MEGSEQTSDTKMESVPPPPLSSQNRTFYSSNAPAYNLLDHPEFYMLGPANNQPFPNNPEREARRVLDSYGGRLHYSENDEEATR